MFIAYPRPFRWKDASTRPSSG